MPRMTKAKQITKFKRTLRWFGYDPKDFDLIKLVNGNRSEDENWGAIYKDLPNHTRGGRKGY